MSETEQTPRSPRWQQDEYSDKIWRHAQHRGKQITILLSATDVNDLEARLARAEGKAALADRIREWFASDEEEDGIDFEAWCRDFDAVLGRRGVGR